MEKRQIVVMGFPKSGNTWLTRMLSDYYDCRIKLNEGGNFLISNGTKAYSNKEVELVKRHNAINIQSYKSSPFIYVIRNPIDQIVSGVFHHHRSLQEKKLTVLEKFFVNYKILTLSLFWGSGLVNRLKNIFKWFFRDRGLVVGGWSGHVRYWTAKSNAVIVRYEDLVSNTELDSAL